MMITPIDSNSQAGARARSGAGGRGGRRDLAGSDLVEAGTAVDGPIGSWCEWNHGLVPTGIADRRVVLPWTTGSGAFRDGPAVRAALGDVQEALLGEEPLLAAREDEALAAVAAAECLILKHRASPPIEGCDQVCSAPRRPCNSRAG